ncbi:phosphoenolpyruvate--protein phosphotransferase [Photobacterium leiognathi]|uniref:phosphoenolpyruvate--protein phosphotransferase n=1 Tax=Photobacterium leiognathi TaxID=553611 RepID=UPI001EDFEB8E|nr:phosphoenolpyruvate--protein phosphotransferase [Photobacterium leiognathi]MCG3884496.1 phosphoenolpyruvate--protein phosphotransferase [Photobacterium leiognathi]
MVGIVIVSHSKRLAEGVAELATQMTQGAVNLSIAAGVDDPENPIGTDAVAVMSSIEEVYDDSGVVVLMDLGSALLSAEMAIELLDPEMAEKVKMISAPIVEGAMAASVAAAAGLPVETVISEARSALSAKSDHLGDLPSVASEENDIDSSSFSDVLSFSWVVKNPNGIHARPAAAIVGKIASFSCDVWLEKESETVNAKSLNKIAKLAVRNGDEIRFLAAGDDAAEAIASFEQLANEHFGEADLVKNGVKEKEDEVEVTASNLVDGALTGISVNGGIVSAPVVKFAHVMPAIPDRLPEYITIESANLRNAMSKVEDRLLERSKEDNGDIFDAHLMMLTDPELWDSVLSKLESGLIAEQAWVDSMAELADVYKNSPSEYMREREADVRDIARQVMVELTGDFTATIKLDSPCVLFASDLMPSDVADLDKEFVHAICLEQGGRTSHSAILARAMGIPAVVKVAGCLDAVHDGQVVTLDGFCGMLWLSPSEETIAELDKKRTTWVQQKEIALQKVSKPALTQDGTHISVLANIGGPKDLALAVSNGAEGVGLFRTEFLFQASSTLPTEDEQFEIYKDVAEAFNGNPVTVRTLDVGGDKPLASFPMPKEDNPFLGVRGIRLCLKHKELFISQIRALIRAFNVCPNIQVMLPMISTVAEINEVKNLIRTEAAVLGIDCEAMNVGIMIEVPAAVLNADMLASESDFFSIGTNDLTQYVMAADRGNPELSNLVNYFEPSVIKAIEMTCIAGDKAGIPVSMCGEMAGDVDATELLLKLGLRKFSASASVLPELKEQIRDCELSPLTTQN